MDKILRGGFVLGTLLLHSATAQVLTPSNWTTATQTQETNDTITAYIYGSKGGDPYFVDVLPLTAGAQAVPSDGLSGPVFAATHGNTLNTEYIGLNSDQAVLLSCDQLAGELQAPQVLNQISGEQISWILLYSEHADYCNLTDYSGLSYIFSTKSISNATNLVNKANEQTDSATATLTGAVGPRGEIEKQIANHTPQTDRTPTTAAAMIILYAITGVVALLFALIIITGAVRAHRHPERYGPRIIVGRSRQGRAKGLARAMLDTLPIVKFGEQREGEDVPKTVDVELGETESRNGSTTGGAEEISSMTQAAAHNREVKAVEPTSRPDSTGPETWESGLGGATVPAAAATSTPPPLPPATRDAAAATDPRPVPSQSECAICAEDFEAGQDQRVLPCDHRFHPHCIDPWLLNISGTCPLCRIDLRAGTDEENDDNIENAENGDVAGNLPPPIAPAQGTSGGDSRRLSVARALLLTLTNPGGPARAPEGTNRYERFEARRQVEEERRQLALRVARARETAGVAGGGAGDLGGEEEQRRNRNRVRNFLRRSRGGGAANATGSGNGSGTTAQPAVVTLRVGDASAPSRNGGQS